MEDLTKDGLSERKKLGRIVENQKTDEKTQRPQPETKKLPSDGRPGSWTTKV